MKLNFGNQTGGDLSQKGKYVGLVVLLLFAVSACSHNRRPVTIFHKNTITRKGDKISNAASTSSENGKERAGTASGGSREELTFEWQEGFKDAVKAELREELLGELKNESAIKSEIEWMKRISLGGDIRLRYENDRFDRNNALFTRISEGMDTQELENSWVDQHRFKYRVRLGGNAIVSDTLEAVIRLSTGSTTDPVSTNSTMGDHMNKDSIVSDRAYLEWTPWRFFSLDGGRQKNPWLSSDLVWDSDIAFEGLVLNTKYPGKSFSPFITLGVFPLQQNGPVSTFEYSEHLKWLYGAQMGFKKRDSAGVSFEFGAAFYNFSNIEGKLNTDPGKPGAKDWSAHLFTQRGKNTLFFIDDGSKVGLVSKFRELNITGTLDVAFWSPVHIRILADYVRNTAYDHERIKSFTPDIDSFLEGNQSPPKGDSGFQIGISAGYPTIRKAGEWNGFLRYKRLEVDSVLDSFTDSNFHLGGTNAKGWILGTELGLMENSWLTIQWLTADEVAGPPLSIDVLQVDFNAKF